jgi:small subunit ribosomal protein S20
LRGSVIALFSFAARIPGIYMANIASQKKRIARTQRERLENLQFKSAVKTHFKRLEDAVRAGDADKASTEHKSLVSRIDKAVQKGALHRNTGARKKARAARIIRPSS